MNLDPLIFFLEKALRERYIIYIRINSLNVLLLKENIFHLKIHNILSLMSSSELKYSKHIITNYIQLAYNYKAV